MRMYNHTAQTKKPPRKVEGVLHASRGGYVIFGELLIVPLILYGFYRKTGNEGVDNGIFFLLSGVCNGVGGGSLFNFTVGGILYNCSFAFIAVESCFGKGEGVACEDNELEAEVGELADVILYGKYLESVLILCGVIDLELIPVGEGIVVCGVDIDADDSAGFHIHTESEGICDNGTASRS